MYLDEQEVQTTLRYSQATLDSNAHQLRPTVILAGELGYAQPCKRHQLVTTACSDTQSEPRR